MKFPHPPVSKARKPKFELFLRVHDLNNVPLVTGTSFVKWHLPSSTAAEHRGRTERALVKEHKVIWNYTRTIPVRLSIDRNSNLQDCLISFEMVQDCPAAGKAERITLGKIDLNLAEYVDDTDVPSGCEKDIVRRYLMQDSKINSTLKIGIRMKQIDGERNYIVPPLRTAMIFGGITGIVSGDQDMKDEIGRELFILCAQTIADRVGMPTISNSEDYGEIQDMYRRTLAASWASHDGELTADQCIEDIFNGGDGWKYELSPQSRAFAEDSTGDDNRPSPFSHYMKSRSVLSLKLHEVASTVTLSSNPAHKRVGSQETLSACTINQRESNSVESERQSYKTADEVDELSVREDLVAWTIRERTPETVP